MTMKVVISNLKFNAPDRLANALGISKALNMNASNAANLVKANEIKPITMFTQEVNKDIDDIRQILNEYHITCDITKL